MAGPGATAGVCSLLLAGVGATAGICSLLAAGRGATAAVCCLLFAGLTADLSTGAGVLSESSLPKPPMKAMPLSIRARLVCGWAAAEVETRLLLMMQHIMAWK